MGSGGMGHMGTGLGTGKIQSHHFIDLQFAQSFKK